MTSLVKVLITDTPLIVLYNPTKPQIAAFKNNCTVDSKTVSRKELNLLTFRKEGFIA